MKWIFAALIIFFLPACFLQDTVNYEYTQNVSMYSRPQKTFYIFIDNKFSEPEKKLIYQAINDWNYTLNNSIRLEVASSSFNMEINILQNLNEQNIWLLLKIDSKSSFIPKPSKKGRRIAAWADAIGGHKIYVVYDDIDSSAMFNQVIMHEIGHLLGADHINGPSLMYDLYNDNYYQCIDYRTMKEVSSFQKINIKSLNYCLR